MVSAMYVRVRVRVFKPVSGPIPDTGIGIGASLIVHNCYIVIVLFDMCTWFDFTHVTVIVVIDMCTWFDFAILHLMVWFCTLFLPMILLGFPHFTLWLSVALFHLIYIVWFCTFSLDM